MDDHDEDGALKLLHKRAIARRSASTTRVTRPLLVTRLSRTSRFSDLS
jgi:hypothetical protein